MSLRLDLPKTLRLIAVPLTLATAFWATDALALQLETPEIVFTTADAKPLADMATQLGNAVAIYEYAHNYFEFSAYHGSRSGSINTFMGQRGSDVDIATTLIAMMRSQNIPARYAVGTIRVPAAQLTNWLGVGNLDVAVQVLKDQGIQGVVLATDRSTVDLEHVWAEVSVPFAQYRGLTTSGSVDCSLPANASSCNWIPLDGSFKQKTYNGLNIDPYNALSFDYTGYYRAIVDSANDPLKRQDKNPLTILEEQIATWLRTSNPGKTLEDVADTGQINQIHDGLLPASLPYTVTGTIRHYDSVALHDAAVPASEPKKWGKTVSVVVKLVLGGLTIQAGGTPILLAEVNTKRLTLSTEFQLPGNVPNMVIRLGGVEISRPISGGGTIGYTPAIGNPYTIMVSMDGTPDASGGSNDKTITAAYSGIIGGYYLIATGGETSNWSQVHRAADQLLANNIKDTIVFKLADNNVINPATGLACDLSTGLNCTPYVDINGTGVYAANDPQLLQDKPVLDDLTGGLLYVAASQYFANLHDQFDRADHLMKTKTPILGFLGVVSSTYEAEYIGGTAFSILPGGLLIDMKGITISGSYRTNDTPLTYSNRQFEFIGHIGSSLEHETWQELTGYDAVSTVRGIQMALATPTTTLLDVKFDGVTNTLPAFYTKVGFGALAPAPFLLVKRTIYTTTPNSWSNPTFRPQMAVQPR
jgi:transglutaminase-like putative cysteine protease